MPKKLAITIAGAVSLGCYEAGVLFEIVRAIGEHNLDPATDVNERIEIDVLTGASAGGITCTLAAQKLLFEATSLQSPYANSLYRPWVTDINLDGLLNLQSQENPTYSMLSSNFVEDISRKYITQRYESQVTPLIDKHPASAQKVWLGLALSNLNGIDYQRTVEPTGTFCYTSYQDQICRLFESAVSNDNADIWEPFRNAAIACSAFPFAFRTKELVRHESEYANPFLVPFSSPVESFTYTDGGVFQNEPLGMAKNLVDLIDPGHVETANRFYLFVAPGARKGTSGLAFNESKADLGGTAKQLLTDIFQQARFHDWIQAEQVNDKIRLFNDRSMALHRAFLLPAGSPGAIDFNVLAPAAKQLLPPLFGNNVAEQSLSWHRLQKQFQSEYNDLVTVHAGNTRAADTWIDCVLAFETAADLGDKDEMRIYGITADEKELASSKFEAFQGFFDQSYRDHDYDVGRNHARDVLEKINSTRDPLGPIRYAAPVDRSDIRPIDHSLDDLDMSKVSLDLRKRLKARLTSRAHDLMAELGIPTAIVREAIDLAFISPQLNKLLALS